MAPQHLQIQHVQPKELQPMEPMGLLKELR